MTPHCLLPRSSGDSRATRWRHRATAVLLLAFPLLALVSCKPKSSDEFRRLTNVGKNYYDRGQGEKAVTALQQALALAPSLPDARLNLANALLLANQPDNALQQAQLVLDLDQNSAAAHYLKGCALLRLGKFEPALKELQAAKDIDRTINAVTFQLGRAHQQLGQFDAAIVEFQETVQFETNHPAAYYTLAQALRRAGKTDEANQALAQHEKIRAGQAGQPTDTAAFERCVYTQIKIAFTPEQPDPAGVKVKFVDATAAAFGPGANAYRGPAGIIDYQHDGRNSLFVVESNGFRLLINSNGVFQPSEQFLPGIVGAKYSRVLVGDLDNDLAEDMIVLGAQGSHVFKSTTNGAVTEVTARANLRNLTATNGLLADLSFSPNLSLLTLGAGTAAMRFYSNLGNMYFVEKTANAAFPPDLAGARQLLLDDWNGDDLPDLFIGRDGQPPLLLTRQRGAPFTATNSPADWPVGSVIAVGDLNNDLRPDLLVAAKEGLVCVFNGQSERATISLGDWPVTGLTLLDYDNDGWLDILAAGPGLRVWRNLGNGKFREATRDVGLEKIGRVESVLAADFDNDCDTDLLVILADQSLRLLRNDGGNANHQLKLRLLGTRSNASGIGIRVEVDAGGLRLARRVATLPVEIGVGQHKQLDSLSTRWLGLNPTTLDVKVDPCALLTIMELQVQDTSCPYLYAWDGKRFRFVTDILSASPLGLPVAENRYVEPDADEYAWIGDENALPPRGGNYVLQITEEMREVLYLDEAKLVAVDHPTGTEIHTTGKLRPGKPIPPGELITLHRRRPLLNATSLAGADVTALLAEYDGKVLSPSRLRVPQLRGLAEPHGVTLDFGPLAVDQPLVLALTGWLKFGGATANMAASLDAGLPFPFPRLEAETGGEWKPVDVVVGAPAGKTKTILADLTGKLPPGSRRLRLTTAFEIHWDRIALFERRDGAETRIASLAPNGADLHWRGFGELESVPWFVPQTPIYDRVTPNPPWHLTPAGWCTRYGSVDELISRRDNALALINSGDELTLTFPASQLPPKPPGSIRDFFLYSVGWDKDADYHTKLGGTIEPLPWHGVDVQRYGKQPRPAFPNDEWITKYNTRWTGPYTLTRKQ
jgi:tetratricopeptide (TPR) repeat protein